MDPSAQFGRGGLNEFVDAERLVDRIGLDDAELEWRKALLGFDSEDEKRLEELEPFLAANQDEIAEEFYENLIQFEETVEVIGRSPKDVPQLKQTQRAYLRTLAAGTYDQSYFANRARIGKLHEMLDMPLKMYVGQYGVYYDLLLERLNERIQTQVLEAVEAWAKEREEADTGGLGSLKGVLGFGSDEEPQAAGLDPSFEHSITTAIDDGMCDVLSLLRIINLDMQVAIDTYVDSYATRLERAIERRKELAHTVENDVQTPIAELHEASTLITNRAETISSHTDTQAATMADAAAHLESMSSTTEEVASVATDVREESERTETLAADGVSIGQEVMADFADIETATERTADTVKALDKRLDEVEIVLNRLDDLARRTSMLARNAKIEATRAETTTGDGQTLGIIADEVQAFAAKTTDELDEIEAAIEAMADEAAATVTATDETVERVETGTKRLREMDRSLELIHEAATQTAAGMEEVSTAADQQATAIEEVTASTEEISATAAEISVETSTVAAACQEQTASLAEVGETISRLTEQPDETHNPVYED